MSGLILVAMRDEADFRRESMEEYLISCRCYDSRKLSGFLPLGTPFRNIRWEVRPEEPQPKKYTFLQILLSSKERRWESIATRHTSVHSLQVWVPAVALSAPQNFRWEIRDEIPAKRVMFAFPSFRTSSKEWVAKGPYQKTERLRQVLTDESVLKKKKNMKAWE